VCGALITKPAPLDMSFAIAWPVLTVAGGTLGVLNLNFKQLSLMEVTKLGATNRVRTFVQHHYSLRPGRTMKAN